MTKERDARRELHEARVELAEAKFEVACLEIVRDLMLEMQAARRRHDVDCECEAHKHA